MEHESNSHSPSIKMPDFNPVNHNRIFNHFSSTSSKKQTDFRRRTIERGIRLVVQVSAIVGMVIMIVDVTFAFLNSPTVTTAETNPYPTQKVEYPAIAICTINRISLKAAIDMAGELMELDTTLQIANITVTDLVKMLKLLGHMYTFKWNPRDVEKVKLLHTILDRGYNGYNVGRIMKRLTPTCRSILRRCAWEGKDQACDDMFYLRKTDSGYCCLFNYARQNDGFGNKGNDILMTQQALHTKEIGSEYGLSVLLSPRLDDYLYQVLPSQGFKIQVYLSLDYPDASSGGMREVLVSPKTETYLDLNAVSFYSDPDVEQYNINKRDCLFKTEHTTIFHGHYTFSDCIMHCRVRDIFHLCKCTPFFYPSSHHGKPKICDLMDLPCLDKYKDKWLILKPRYEVNMVPFNETIYTQHAGYLTCNCLPSCQDTSYRVSASILPLTVSQVSWGRTSYTIRNHSIVHVFFDLPGTVRLKQGVLFYGYELMSNYGGICSFFLGVSVINLVEIIYNFLMALCKSGSNDSTSTTKSEVEEAKKERRRSVSKEEKRILLKKNIPEIKVENSLPGKEPFILYWNELPRNSSPKGLQVIQTISK